ncbi:DMT family transporter [Streptomyces sp. NBC_01456]|uniref:DMT family transporter n=1 Tax=unclassified Streptomyces TaxID=2593676 RepID=UPI002E36A385|nr:MULTISPECIES: DMT family transporter [unclassified Streptomyces]
MVVTAALWGSAFPAISIALPGYSPTAIAVLRMGISALLLLPFLLQGRIRTLGLRDALRMATFGLAGMTAYQLLLYAGEQSVDAGTAAMLISTSPIFVMLLGAFLLGERPSARGTVGLGVALSGALLIAMTTGHSGGTLAGAGLVIAAAAAQAASFVVQKPLLARYSGIECTFYGSLFGALPLLPFLPSTISQVATADWHGTAAVIWLSVGCTVFAFCSWSRTLSATSASTSSLVLYGVPVAALAVNAALTQSAPAHTAFVGGALVLAGVAFTATRRPQTAPSSRTGTRPTQAPCAEPSLPQLSQSARLSTQFFTERDSPGAECEHLCGESTSSPAFH